MSFDILNGWSFWCEHFNAFIQHTTQFCSFIRLDDRRYILYYYFFPLRLFFQFVFSLYFFRLHIIRVNDIDRVWVYNVCVCVCIRAYILAGIRLVFLFRSFAISIARKCMRVCCMCFFSFFFCRSVWTGIFGAVVTQTNLYWSMRFTCCRQQQPKWTKKKKQLRWLRRRRRQRPRWN